MGKKSRRKKQMQKLEVGFMKADVEDPVLRDILHMRKGMKERSKICRKAAKRHLKMQLKMIKEKKKEIDEDHEKQCWFKISVDCQEPLDKQFLLESIGSYLEVPFVPLGFHRSDKRTCFFLQGNPEGASSIEGLNKRIQSPSGETMKIIVTKISCPDIILNVEQLQVLKEVLAKRYDEVNSLLNLSSLHTDPLLIEKDILATVACSLVFKQVIKMVRTNIPDLRAINLSCNGLNEITLIPIEGFAFPGSHLTRINLQSNQFENLVPVLRTLKRLQMTELNLEYNPFMANIKMPPKYIASVKASLPSLEILDGMDVTNYLQKRNVVLDKIETLSLASPQPTLITSRDLPSPLLSPPDMTENTVRIFLEQYYATFDGPDRSQILEAYTPMAKLEIDAELVGIKEVVERANELGAIFSKLPVIQHDPLSFALNMVSVEPRRCLVQVKGDCLVGGEQKASFLRTMTIVPYKQGYCCSKDIWIIGNNR